MQNVSVDHRIELKGERPSAGVKIIPDGEALSTNCAKNLVRSLFKYFHGGELLAFEKL